MATRKFILAIGAHPDDVEIGCGGALARHAAQGEAIMILTLTRGAIGGDIERRSQESHRVAELLGAQLVFGELNDGQISEGVETITLIEDAIKAFHPTHIYTHTCHDTHQDHRATHHAAMVAARHVKNFYCYQSPSSTVDFRPNYFVDISAFMESKLELIAAYESQTSRRNNLAPDLMLATARYWGRYAGYGLVEPMLIMRQFD
ncbi:MAG: PIG-L family deacetylase [Acidobacteriaceae bacterium]|nr:PIG-L family deacetylase [Acidobacteriaceae bacterium]